MNKVPVNSCPDFHDLKAYLNLIITSNREQELNPLSASGYFFDSAQVMGTQMSGSWNQRMLLFKDQNGAYFKDPVTFAGPLFTDLQGCSQGVPPGVEVTLQFYKNKDEILIETFDGTSQSTITTAPDYKVRPN